VFDQFPVIVGAERPAIPGYAIHGWLYETPFAYGWVASRYADGADVIVETWRHDVRENEGPELLAGAKIGALLKVHRSIAEVIDQGFCDERPFIVLQGPWTGGSPPDVLRNTIDDDHARPHAIEIARDVANALVHLHQYGVVHGGISPSTILVAGAPDKAVSTLAGLWTLGGATAPDALCVAMDRIRYCSPENINGAPTTMHDDLWALGACLYEMVVGVPFADGETILDVATRLGFPDSRPTRPDVRDDLFTETIERALDPRPERRYPTALALRDALYALD
jgi:eukaryotic-like serine/threonine-protein kinase